MKRNAFAISAMCIVMALCGLSVWRPETAAAAPQAKLPSSVMMGAGQQGSSTYAIAVAISDVLQKRMTIPYSVSPAPGLSGVVELLRSKEVQLGIINTSHARLAYTGAKGVENLYKGYAAMGPVRSLRLLVAGDRMPLGILARGNIYTPKDLRGKRVYAIDLGSEGTYASVLGILKASNMSQKDMTFLEYPDSSVGIKWVAEGKGDAVHTSASGAKIKEFEMTVGKGNGRFVSIPLTPAAMKIYQFYYPGVVPYTEEVGIPCVPKGTTMYAMVNALTTRDDISDDLAYAVTKTVMENTQTLAAVRKELAAWDIKSTLQYLPAIPFHPGAIKYFKEKGAWTGALEKRQQELLKF